MILPNTVQAPVLYSLLALSSKILLELIGVYEGESELPFCSVLV